MLPRFGEAVEHAVIHLFATSLLQLTLQLHASLQDFGRVGEGDLAIQIQSEEYDARKEGLRTAMHAARPPRGKLSATVNGRVLGGAVVADIVLGSAKGRVFCGFNSIIREPGWGSCAFVVVGRDTRRRPERYTD